MTNLIRRLTEVLAAATDITLKSTTLANLVDLRNINKGSHALNKDFHPASTPVSPQRYFSNLKSKV